MSREPRERFIPQKIGRPKAANLAMKIRPKGADLVA
jgi:hypothetical protein